MHQADECPPPTVPLHFHVTNGESESQRGEVISPSSYSMSAGELGPESESKGRIGLSVFLISNSQQPHTPLPTELSSDGG